MEGPEYTIGIDVGGTKMLGVVVPATLAPTGDVVASLTSRQVPTPAAPGSIVQSAADLVAGLAAEVGGSPRAIGIGLPGFIDRHGIARQAPNLPGIVDRDIVGELRTSLGIAVRADNDANCAAWAAACLDAPGVSTVVAVTLGTGIGGGLVIDGQLVRGAHGFAGEPGHTIVDPDGPWCVCGQRGCWEVWASGSGLARVAAAAIRDGRAPRLAERFDAPDGPTVMRLVEAGDPEALAVLAIFGRWVAIGLVNLINVIDPEVVVLSGGIVANGSALLDAIHAELATFPTTQGGRQVDLRISSVGPRAGAVGAGLLAWGDRPAP